MSRLSRTPDAAATETLARLEEDIQQLKAAAQPFGADSVFLFESESGLQYDVEESLTIGSSRVQWRVTAEGVGPGQFMGYMVAEATINGTVYVDDLVSPFIFDYDAVRGVSTDGERAFYIYLRRLTGDSAEVLDLTLKVWVYGSQPAALTFVREL